MFVAPRRKTIKYTMIAFKGPVQNVRVTREPLGTLGTFEQAMAAASYGVTTACALPARRYSIDAEYTRLRAIRRRPERRARKTNR